MGDTTNAGSGRFTVRFLIGSTIAALLACFTVYTIVAGQFSAQVQRGTFLLCAGLAVFCFKPFNSRWEEGDNQTLKWFGRGITILFAGMLLYSVLYLFLNYFEIAEYREGWPNTADLICYTLGTLSVLEGVRRTHGWLLLSVVMLVLIYLFLGHLMPGILNHQPLSFAEIAEMSFGMNGVFGIALAVVANVVAIFIVLGAILRVTGTGDLFIDLAFILTGRFVGGPAQTAVVSSAFFGSINGSGPANVVSTGSFTIPLMIRCGYKPAFAGAVEATASCVGQIMPPIMGVGAFLMAEITGIPYGRIMVAAIVPALLYSISLLFNVRFQALRQGIRTLPEDQIPRFQNSWIPRILVLVTTTTVLLWKILSGTAPNMAGFSAVATLLAGAFLVKEIRPNLKGLIDMAVEGGKDLLSLTMACSAIGIVIGGLSITGLGVKFSQSIISVGQSNLLLALIMAAFCCIIVGMGLPTAASYLMVVFIAAPAITKLGLPLLTTHLFIFYFAVLSAISPPVALNAYAASGIAKSDPLKTGFHAVRLGLIGFVLPFLWVYNPQIMLGEAGPLVTVITVTACLLAVLALAAANTGYLCRSLKGHERLVVLVSGILLATPSTLARIAGLAVGLAAFLFFRKTAASDPVQDPIGGETL